MSAEPKRRPMPRIIIIGGSALVVAGIVFHVQDTWHPEARDRVTAVTYEPIVYDESARRLLGGLAVGERLDTWTVVEVRGPQDGIIDVVVEREGVRFSIIVTPKGHQDIESPMPTDRFDLYISTPTPPGSLPAGAGMPVLREVHQRVSANEPTTP